MRKGCEGMRHEAYCIWWYRRGYRIDVMACHHVTGKISSIGGNPKPNRSTGEKKPRRKTVNRKPLNENQTERTSAAHARRCKTRILNTGDEARRGENGSWRRRSGARGRDGDPCWQALTERRETLRECTRRERVVHDTLSRAGERRAAHEREHEHEPGPKPSLPASPPLP